MHGRAVAEGGGVPADLAGRGEAAAAERGEAAETGTQDCLSKLGDRTLGRQRPLLSKSRRAHRPGLLSRQEKLGT